ncbi:glycosyltransferase family 4 protein [Hufsiella ginkgonis]|uniref:Glycosyl transferase family 1 n=1 Tax=Hufsiella ginkgonis TaxID=2695274 RepID=A0A7K1Y283_9SPHI|nr:glycosyltransferase family 4 protein [Hufsiella ginkgonis]MXV17380.1 glycosyl transferase family 1 [Hufsiella ginkgonis]
MAELLFIAPYPHEKNLRDGMVQRVKAVDQLFEEDNRRYLDISFTAHVFPEKKQPNPHLTIISLNFFTGLPYILYCFFNAKTVYCHAMYNFAKVGLFCRPGNKKVVLDLHGLVPEERKAEGKRWLSWFYSFAEAAAFRRVAMMVCVTERMEQYYRDKYPAFKGRYVKYAIVPENLAGANQSLLTGNAQERVLVIYSGNTQVWQNIGLMLQTIRNNRLEHVTYLLLTGEPEAMKHQAKAAGLTANDVTILSVTPAELEQYYARAHYGFILRDDISVNRVANPTKMIEYLYYGITPIVKSADIGDFNDLGYDFVSYKDPFSNFSLKKSTKNMQIAAEMLKLNDKERFKQAVRAVPGEPAYDN